MISCWKMRAFFSFEILLNQESDGVKVPPSMYPLETTNGMQLKRLYLADDRRNGRPPGGNGGSRALVAGDGCRLVGSGWRKGPAGRREDRWGAIGVEIGTQIA
jgi:hypothetical protein